jgi:hypothetical protein
LGIEEIDFLQSNSLDPSFSFAVIQMKHSSKELVVDGLTIDWLNIQPLHKNAKQSQIFRIC